MTADISGAGGALLAFGFVFVWLSFAGVILATQVFWVIAIIDIARRPEWQFHVARVEKTTWLLLVILVNFLGIVAFIYWFGVRKRLLAAEAHGPVWFGAWPGAGPASLAPLGPTGRPPPSWYRDPSGRHGARLWDGTAWTEWVADGAATSSDTL